MPDPADLGGALRTVRLRVTRPRLAVLDAVHAHPHLDIEALIGAARTRLDSISHQAVYDVLRVLTDVRVCQLAVEIIEAQERGISEMEWLIEDIEEDGEAETLAEAQARPVPDFDGSALRDCPPA